MKANGSCATAERVFAKTSGAANELCVSHLRRKSRKVSLLEGESPNFNHAQLLPPIPFTRCASQTAWTMEGRSVSAQMGILKTSLALRAE
jgi:hypothetical protein